MSTSSGTSPTGDRFAVISENDHRGVVWVVSILCLIYSLMILVIRTEAKRKNFGIDDLLAGSATILAIPQYIALFVAISRGLGRSFLNMNSSDAGAVGKAFLASEILLLCALCLAKCSVIYLCRRLFSPNMPGRLILCDIAMAISGLWCIGSILAVAIDCPPMELIGFQHSFCPNLVVRWILIGTIDSVIEVIIVLLAALVVLPLQMSATRKAQALVSFCLRLIIVVFAVLHITALSDSTTSSNSGVAVANPAIYLELELFYSILSSAVPALNGWLRNFDTSMGTTWASGYGSQLYGSNDRTAGSASQGYRMDSINSSQLKAKTPKRLDANTFNPVVHQYTASCERQVNTDRHSIHSQEAHSHQSMNSEEMIIRKDVGWNVTYEDHDGPVEPVGHAA